MKILAYLSPLPIFLMSLDNYLAEEKFRAPWSDILLWSGVPFAALLLTVLLTLVNRRKIRASGFFFFIPAMVVWIISCLLGAFPLAVSFNPGWLR